MINPSIHNVPKWSDTLLKSCSIGCKIFKVSDHFGTLCIKGLSMFCFHVKEKDSFLFFITTVRSSYHTISRAISKKIRSFRSIFQSNTLNATFSDNGFSENSLFKPFTIFGRTCIFAI